MTPEIFGKNLKEVRESLGMSQAELAKLSGLTPAAICQIENNKRDPLLRSVLAIMRVIPVKFERLVQ